MVRRNLVITLLSLLLCVPCSTAMDLSEIDIHGFVSQGFLLSKENNYLSVETTEGSFQFNELGINFGKTLTDDLRIGIQFFSRDLGRTGNNVVEIDWAFGDYHWRDWLGFRAGLLRVPQGLYNESRDQDMLRTPILLPQSVYPELIRDYYTRLWGIGIYGNLFSNFIGNFSYKLMAGEYDPDIENSGLAIDISARMGQTVEEFHHGIIYAAGLVWDTPLEGLRVGATGLLMNDIETKTRPPEGEPLFHDVEQLWTVYSVEYTRNDLKIAAEYRLRHLEISMSKGGPAYYSNEIDSEGYYISASYRLNDWLELGSYYSIFYPDKDDRNGDSYVRNSENDYQAWLKDFALSSWFTINESWSVKIEGHTIDGAGDLFSAHNPDGLDRHDFLFAAKTTFNF